MTRTKNVRALLVVLLSVALMIAFMPSAAFTSYAATASKVTKVTKVSPTKSSSYTMTAGKSKTFKVKLSPKNLKSSKKTTTVTSSKTSVATISSKKYTKKSGYYYVSFKVNAKTAGTTTVKAYSKYGKKSTSWKVTVKKAEEALAISSAKQTGASKITVAYNKAAAGTETYTVKKGSVDQTVTATTYSADKKSVVLTLDSKIKAAEYTVTTSTGLSATFTGAEAKLAKIEFAGTNAISQGATAGVYAYTARVNTLDQFGDTYTVSTPDSVVVSTVNGSSANYKWDKTGTLTMYSATALTIGTSISAAIVSGNVVGNATLTVSAASTASTITVGAFATDDATLLKATRVNATGVASGKYYFPITAKDQYGNALTAKQLNAMVTAGSLVVSPEFSGTMVLGTVGTKSAGTIFSEKTDGSVIMYVKGDGASYGTGVVSLVSTAGAVASAQATVNQNEMIKTLKIEPASTLQYGVETPATLTATDQYGKTIDLYADVVASTDTVNNAVSGNDSAAVAIKYNGTTTNVTLTNAKLKFTKNTTKKTLSWVVYPVSTNNAATTATVQINTAAVQVSLDTYTIGAQATPDTIASTLGVDTTILANGSVNFAKGLSFVNSDGKTMAGTESNYPTFDADLTSGTTTAVAKAGYYYTINNGTSLEANSTVSNIAATTTYTVTLYKVTGTSTLSATEMDSKTFKVTVQGSTIKSYTASVKSGDELLANWNGSGDVTNIVVKGTDADGNTAVLASGYKLTVNKGLAVSSSTIVPDTTSSVSSSSNPVVAGKATVNVWVNDEIVATTEVSYSNSESVATKAEWLFDSSVSDTSNDLVAASSDELEFAASVAPTVKLKGNVITLTSDNTAYTLNVVDQYGLIIPATFTINTVKYPAGYDSTATSPSPTAPSFTTGNTYNIYMESGSIEKTVKVIVD